MSGTLPWAFGGHPHARPRGTFVARHLLVVFFGLAYLFSWLLWVPLVADAVGWSDGTVSPYWHLLGGMGPLFAAFALTAAISGTRGVRELTARAISRSGSSRMVAAVLLAPVLLFAISACVVRGLEGSWPNLSRFGESTEYPRLPLLVYWVASVICYGFGEEVGWRGFALPRLIQRHGTLTATSILSVLWALWHLPLFIFADGLQRLGAVGIIGWVLSIWTASFLFTWLYLRSGGSILVVALFHGGFDIAITSPVVDTVQTSMGPVVDTVQTSMGALVTIASLAALVALKREASAASNAASEGLR